TLRRGGPGVPDRPRPGAQSPGRDGRAPQGQGTTSVGSGLPPWVRMPILTNVEKQPRTASRKFNREAVRGCAFLLTCVRALLPHMSHVITTYRAVVREVCAPPACGRRHESQGRPARFFLCTFATRSAASRTL